MKRPLSCQPDRQHAVALIVTLIMLAVITVLAVAFLALTRRETAAVDAMGRTTDAELAADSGLERAKAELMASFIRRNATNNGLERMGPDLMVSVARDTNRIYDAANNLFLANRVDPGVPVLVNTNRGNQNGRPDDRFYLDLNRNGLFDETGFILETDNLGNTIPNSWHWEIGDPQWLGILQQPQFPHSRTNQFVGRYAYAVLPVGRGLDINYIHNQAIVGRNAANDAYFRNQGFGTYEINLAAFLADLNTNAWHRPSSADPDAYRFEANPSPTFAGSSGLAFVDARELLNFRYNGNRNNLLSVNQMFPSVDAQFGASSMFPDWIDGYANGPVEVLGGPIYRQPPASPNPEINDDPNQPWPGSDNPKRFFALHDFFDPAKLNTNTVSRRLREAGESRGSYDRSTFYRMLAQLGTDSDEESGKININYKNRDGVSPRQFVNWTPIEVLTNIAGRLLRDEFGIDLRPGRGIPIFTNGSINAINGRRNDGPLYSSRIHQILQLAANICDATYSNKYTETAPFYPSVFRPRFETRGNDVFIVDYEEVTDATPLNATFLSLDEPADRGQISPTANIHIYGVPFIIGARKGFPNFNELVVQTAVEVGRKLEFVKNAVTARLPQRTNQQFIIGISNTFAMEAWYPYTNMGAYPPAGRQAGIKYGNRIIATLTNESGLRGRWDYAITGTDPILSQGWASNTFRVPPIVVTNLLEPSLFYQNPPGFERVAGNNRFEQITAITNRWGLTLTNRFYYFLTERDPSGRERIVDAVSLAGADKLLDITAGLAKGDVNDAIASSMRLDLSGIRNQILVSLGQGGQNDNWNSYGGFNPIAGQDKQKSIDAFRVYMGLTPLSFPTNPIPSPTAIIQAPFTAARKLYQTTSWAVNDPLVHYRVEELSAEPAYFRYTNQNDVAAVSLTYVASLNGSYSTLSNHNREYRPWGGRAGSSTDSNDYDTSAKDPGIFSPDFWDFPQQKLPSVGWLGRIHRGTPWQTVYFKSRPAGNNYRRQVGGAYDTRSLPTNDWRLADLFTVAVHPNQTRGRLSINQTNLAAWSAVLSGIQVTTIEDNSGTPIRTNQVAQPAAVDVPLHGVDAALVQVLNGPFGINTNRMNPNRRSTSFTQLADILAVPALTDESPFLKLPYSTVTLLTAQRQWQYPATDSDYERIPQQILSLLRTGESRFVVYAWGQSLKPAGPVPGISPSIVTSGQDIGLVKNYQVTGEMASRAVIHVEFEDELAYDDNGNLIRDTNGNAVKTGRRDYRKPHAVVESFNIVPLD